MARTTYQLGGFFDGKLFFYTGFAETRSLESALAQQAARPHRSACDVIIKQIPCVSGGVQWGIEHEFYSAIDGAKLEALK